MPLDAGTRVGRYTIVRLIAQGGMAEVYRAEQELTPGVKRPAAVKLIRPEYSESEDFRQMFLDEARTACTLAHPNIVHIYEVGESDDGQLYMAMELVPGETLATIHRTLRNQNERFSDEALFAIGIATASALEAAHALKVEDGQVNLVHRDVSPHNLLLSASGNLKLIDFGIAKAATNRNLTMPGITKGKAGYFSPEQAMGKKLDGRSDLFSLGVTLYKLASGSTPFDGHSTHGDRHAALVRGQWKPLADHFPGLPTGLYSVVNRALQLKPENRYANARELREELERAAFDAGIRVSQSSLIGYVDDDGEVTATGGTRSSAFPAVVPPPATPPASQPEPPPPPPAPPAEETASPPPSAPRAARPAGRRAGPTRAVWLGIAFGAAVVVGIFGVMLALDRREPVVLEAPLALEEPPRAAVTPPVEPRAVVPAVEAPQLVGLVIDAGSEDVPLASPVRPPRTSRVVTRAPRETAVPPPPTPPSATPPVEEAVIPAGEGKLRIGATNAGAVAGVVVGRDDWGAPPVNRSVPSGTYTVLLKLTDGRRSVPWKGAVFPDRTTALVYDVEAGRWTAK